MKAITYWKVVYEIDDDKHWEACKSIYMDSKRMGDLDNSSKVDIYEEIADKKNVEILDIVITDQIN